MNFEPIRQLQVSRRLSNGQKVPVGTLAQNSEQVYFSYHADYVEEFGNLSPFAINKIRYLITTRTKTTTLWFTRRV